MPFTFSHPAIVLPFAFLNKKWFSLTGLIIGSLTPDFEYFIRMKIMSLYSHSFWGVFWFDLPLGVLLCFIFHLLIKNSLFDNLPKFLSSRSIIFKDFDWKNYFQKYWFVVFYSIVVGAFSHLFWDSFTHEDGYFATHISGLKNSILIFENPIFIYKILQHFSSVLGAFVILYAIIKLPKKDTKNHQINIKYWLYIFVITAIILSVRCLFGLNINAYGNVIVSSISAIILALLIAPFLLQKKHPKIKTCNHSCYNSF